MLILMFINRYEKRSHCVHIASAADTAFIFFLLPNQKNIILNLSSNYIDIWYKNAFTITLVNIKTITMR